MPLGRSLTARRAQCVSARAALWGLARCVYAMAAGTKLAPRATQRHASYGTVLLKEPSCVIGTVRA